jgi:hypothetical protein
VDPVRTWRPASITAAHAQRTHVLVSTPLAVLVHALISILMLAIVVLVWPFRVVGPCLPAVTENVRIWLLVRSIVVYVALLRVLGCYLLAVMASVPIC